MELLKEGRIEHHHTTKEMSILLRNVSGVTSSMRYLSTSRLVQNFSFPPSRQKGKGINLSLNLQDALKGKKGSTGDTTSNSGNANSTNEGVKFVDPRFMKQFNSESIYDPFDFSMARINLDRKFHSNKKPLNKINPLDLYLYPEVLSKYVSSTGKILHSDVTGLSPRDQRLISKAIRRCQAIGLMSKTSNNYNR